MRIRIRYLGILLTLDPGLKKIRIRDKYHGAATLI
jgi:hypothetical protein